MLSTPPCGDNLPPLLPLRENAEAILGAGPGALRRQIEEELRREHEMAKKGDSRKRADPWGDALPPRRARGLTSLP